MSERNCSVDDCEAPALSRGMCNKHYLRVRRHGTPNRPPLEEVLWSRVRVGEADECWPWLRGHTVSGYPLLRSKYVHRLVYELEVGKIPPGHQVDHICMNKSCCNPAHLRPATNKQNNEHQGLHANNTSGFRGVSLHRPSGLYMAMVTHNGERHYLGYFTDPAVAGEAARKKRLELFTHNDRDRVDTN